MSIIVRPAKPADVTSIVDLVNRYAEQNVMLPRTKESVRATLRDWLVAVEEEPTPSDPAVLAFGALVPLTESLVEIRSLAVHESQQGRGLGGTIVLALVEVARQRGFQQVCALTLREQFFERLGFDLVDRWSISPKVWQACIYCPKFHRCDEVAVLLNLVEARSGSGDALTRPAWGGLLRWNAWQPLKLAYKQPSDTISAETRPPRHRS